MQQTLSAWKKKRFQEAAGGVVLGAAAKNFKISDDSHPIVWISTDTWCNSLASGIYMAGLLTPIPNGRPYEL